MGVFALFSAVDYKAWYALGEFVDNSVQSFLDHRTKLRRTDGPSSRLLIIIDTQASAGEAIRVWDNAAGIPERRLDAAFQVAMPPEDTSGLSVYGIGMKSAAAWFGDRFTVTSSALGESVRRTVSMHFPTIIAERLDDIDVEEAAEAKTEHFTELHLSELHHPIQTRTHEKVRRHLASIYRSYLRSGDVSILYNGEPLTYRDPEILIAPRWSAPRSEPVEWRKPIDITLKTGERIRGFAALRKTADTKAPGFALFRQERVITGIEDDPWRPEEIFGQPNKYPAQRLFGELHLENVKVSYSKNGFVWQAAEDELISKLRTVLDEEPRPLIRQAHGYRARLAEQAERQAATRALQRTADAIEAAAGPVIEEQLDETSTDDEAAEFDSRPLVDHRTIRLSVNGATWEIRAELSNQDPPERWVELADEVAQERRIQIRISLSHPFSRRFAATDAEDLEALIRVAACLALSVVVARMARGTPFFVLHTFNELLERAMSTELR